MILPEDKRIDWLDSLKSAFRKYPVIYNAMTWLISPIYFPYNFEKEFINSLKGDGIVINLGSGVKQYNKSILNLDLRISKITNICCDAHNLPLKNLCVEAILCLSMLEHVQQPQTVISEMHRVLKPKGKIFVVVPFIFGFHGSPNDFHRWTIEGLRYDFGRFRDVMIKPLSGPTSSLICVLHDWLAVVLSFNLSFLYKFNVILFMILLFPFKFMDILFSKYDTSSNIASTFILTAQKGSLE